MFRHSSCVELVVYLSKIGLVAQHVDPDEFGDVSQPIVLLFFLDSGRHYHKRVPDDRLLALDEVFLVLRCLALSERCYQVLELFRLVRIHVSCLPMLILH